MRHPGGDMEQGAGITTVLEFTSFYNPEWNVEIEVKAK